MTLTPGNFVNTTGTTSAIRPELGGTVEVDTIRPFSIDVGGGNFTTGFIQDRVLRETASGTLDFYYRIVNDVSSGGSVDFITRDNFTAFTTDVDYRLDDLETIGTDQAVRNAAGDEILFDFLSTNLVFPGATSHFFFVKTDATEYDEGGTGRIAISSDLGGGTFAFNTFQPIIPGTITGDYNGSGQVEQGDLNLVLSNWGDVTPPVPSGWVNDLPIGQIDQAELDKVLSNWGNTSAPDRRGVDLAAVPEPGAGLVCLAMFAGIMACRSSGTRPGGRAAAAL